MSIVRICGELGHRLPVGRAPTPASPSRVSALREAVVAGRDREARRHPLHVVLERARAASRRSRSGRTAAAARARRTRRSSTGARRRTAARPARPSACPCRSAAMILRRAPVEGERRDHHPPVPDRHQVRLPGRVLLLEQRDRIGPVRRRSPAGVAGQRRAFPRLPARARPAPPGSDVRSAERSSSTAPFRGPVGSSTRSLPRTGQQPSSCSKLMTRACPRRIRDAAASPSRAHHPTGSTPASDRDRRPPLDRLRPSVVSQHLGRCRGYTHAFTVDAGTASSRLAWPRVDHLAPRRPGRPPGFAPPCMRSPRASPSGCHHSQASRGCRGSTPLSSRNGRANSAPAVAGDSGGKGCPATRAATGISATRLSTRNRPGPPRRTGAVVERCVRTSSSGELHPGCHHEPQDIPASLPSAAAAGGAAALADVAAAGRAHLRAAGHAQRRVGGRAR